MHESQLIAGRSPTPVVLGKRRQGVGISPMNARTRIWELRHVFGYHIENREEHREDGTVLSSYRLVPEQPTLFDISPPDRSYLS
jgi:hypothetical protein